MARRKIRKATPTLNDAMKRNSQIFRLRGFYANAKTLPFNHIELGHILKCVDDALVRLDAETQSSRVN